MIGGLFEHFRLILEYDFGFGSPLLIEESRIFPEIYPLSSHRFEMFKSLHNAFGGYEPCWVISSLLGESPTIKSCTYWYNVFSIISAPVFKQIYAALDKFGLIINTPKAIEIAVNSPNDYSYLANGLNKNTAMSCLKAKALSAFKRYETSSALDRLERSLGLVWKEDMFRVSENVEAGEKKVFYPLTLLLANDPDKFLKSIKSKFSAVTTNNEDSQKTMANKKVESNELQQKKEGAEQSSSVAASENKTDIKDAEIIIKKHSEIMTSLMNFDKSVFKDIFLNEKTFTEEYNI